jgi:hypothetical protein
VRPSVLWTRDFERGIEVTLRGGTLKQRLVLERTGISGPVDGSRVEGVSEINDACAS